MSKEQEMARPPQAPEIGRRILLTRLQWAGMPLLLLLPLLAALGVFGVSRQVEILESEELAVEISYPSRTRLRMSGSLEVAVSNRLDRPLPGVIVGVDRGYVGAFANVTFTPSAASVDDSHYRIELGDVAPGDTRVVAADLMPERYWGLSGTVRIEAEGVEALSTQVYTFVFP